MAATKKMTIQEIATVLGGSTNGPWINMPGPDHSISDRSLGFRFNPNQPHGIGIHSFAGDDPDVCQKHIRKKLNCLTKGNLSVVEEKVRKGVDQTYANAGKALLLWRTTVGAAGTPVENYLGTRFCLPLSKTCLTEVLRFHPSCPMGTERVPAMIAMMQDAVTGEFTGVHRTALKDDGSGKRTMPGKASAKMMLGRAKRAVVMMSPGAPRMGIAEGIETSLSAQKLFNLPVWACLSAPGVAAFPIIQGIRHLIIFADHDQAGLAAAHRCARRYAGSGITAEIRHPAKSGTDWNDSTVKEFR